MPLFNIDAGIEQLVVNLVYEFEDLLIGKLIAIHVADMGSTTYGFN